ncbi:P-II family nitrogen regulator [Oscillatoria salina]|uniref:P-II family nitrogen regulator n=1 Tax=Oscillatoria salina TaxID=331517 RepID=UPI0013B90E67|nr:hypothetical protein [Oscillatoria salina]MBZ8178704.1 hypothetical protein [Oscillatoria salina IIICB1]NET88270.1 hypothetical protein [Kamptonema sp. SIO1D9]
MSSNSKEAVLVTIICESVLQDRLAKLLKELGISGYTVVQAQGAGSHGRRMGDIASFLTNIELKTIVSLELSEKLIEQLHQYKEKYALIAYRQQVDSFID